MTFDPAKNARNITERGLSFKRVTELDWETAVSQEDRRRNYGETRIQVLAFLGKRLHAAVVTIRSDALHVISFRKASRKEVRWYEQERG